MTTFEDKTRYRFRAIDLQIEQIPESGNVLVEIVCEVTLGSLLGRRAKWTGWLNSDENAARAVKELRATGWTGDALGVLPFRVKPSEWPGFGTKEFEGEVRWEEYEVEVDGRPEMRKSPRVCFLRSLAELTVRNPPTREAIEGLSRKFARLLQPRNGTTPGAGARAPTEREQRDADDLNMPGDYGAPDMQQNDIPFG